VLCGIAAGAFAFGVSLTDGSSPREEASPDTLPLSQLAGERIVAGFEGTRVPRLLRRMIRSGEVAGVVLYADNLPTRATGRALTRRLQAIRRPSGLRDPLLILADQEGGLVKRIDGAPAGSALEMSARGPAFAREQGRFTAANLRAVGINVDLAPVLDVARPGSELAAQDRAWGHTPAGVVAGAVPFATSLQAGGVAAAAKHFPGLGAVSGNTDSGLERVPLSAATLRRLDEVPFRAFAEAGGEVVMVGAAIYPSFSPEPALFSRAIVSGELRDRLGFEGVAITDALDTASALSVGPPARAGLAAAGAGADLLLYTDPGRAQAALKALGRHLRNGSLPRRPFEESVQRVLGLRHELKSPSG
jgi:beta-N-acetylhexosaminidase